MNGPQNSTAGAEIAAKEKHGKWTTIGPDYAFGRQSWEYFQKALKERQPGVEFLEETAFPKLGAEDYNSFIATLQNSGADAIWCSLWGNDLVNFIRQANSFGVATIGGLGSLLGSLVGALIIGLVNAFGIVIAPRARVAFPFILMAIALIFRPQGLFGK